MAIARATASSEGDGNDECAFGFWGVAQRRAAADEARHYPDRGGLPEQLFEHRIADDDVGGRRFPNHAVVATVDTVKELLRCPDAR